MAYIDKVFNKNFIEYASYVIKDRAIPHIEDGLKPVQRRILHSLYEMEDGKFHKVANAVGHCMKYHPHGDVSIYAGAGPDRQQGPVYRQAGKFREHLHGRPGAAQNGTSNAA